MAELQVTTAGASQGRALRSLVFTSKDDGYQFYINSSGQLAYIKTTDGGATWSGAVVVSSATTLVAFDVWYDQWTPGDSGTLIHIWYFDTTADDVQYRTLDTSGNVLGTQRTVFSGASSVAGIGAFVSGAKMRGGDLFCAFDIDAGAEKGFYRSTNAGVSWTSRAATLVEATTDWALVFPGNAADANDARIVYYDASAGALTLKEHDDSAGTTSESATICTITANTTDLTGQYPFSGSIRHSDGHLIVTVVTERDTATSDHRTFDIDGAGSITELAAITTNIDDHYYASVFIDQSTDDLYVAYNGARDGSQQLGVALSTGSRIYYTKSTDDGASWSAGDTAYDEAPPSGTVQNFQTWAPLMGSRFLVTWRDPLGSPQSIITNAVNSLDLSTAPQVVGLAQASETSTAQSFAKRKAKAIGQVGTIVETLIDGFTDASPIAGVQNPGDEIGQAFTAPSGGPLTKATFTMQAGGTSPSGPLRAHLYAATGTVGTNAVATGSRLATSSNTIDAATLTGSFLSYDFTFDGSYSIVSSVDYVVVVEFDTSGSGTVGLAADNSSPTHAGNFAGFAAASGSWIGTSALDVLFDIYTGAASSGEEAMSFTAVLTAGSTTVALNQASEADAAQALAKRKAKAFGQATEESSAAQAMTHTKVRALGQAVNISAANAWRSVKSGVLAAASDAHTAQVFSRSKSAVISQSVESGIALSMTVVGGASVTSTGDWAFRMRRRRR